MEESLTDMPTSGHMVATGMEHCSRHSELYRLWTKEGCVYNICRALRLNTMLSPLEVLLCHIFHHPAQAMLTKGKQKQLPYTKREPARFPGMLRPFAFCA